MRKKATIPVRFDRRRSVLKTMIWFARQGFRVLPVHGIVNGRCTCKNGNCESPGKHPIGSLIHNGANGATTEIKTIRGWHKQHPDMNYAVATKGLAVIDCDSQEALRRFRRTHRPPPTLTVKTGRGFHFYYRGEMPARNGALAKLDVKSGPGVYVVGPGSIHASGAIYAIWEDKPIVDLPDTIREITSRLQDEAPLRNTDPLPVGMRNTTLAKFAGYLHARYVPSAAILDGLLALNDNLSSKPLSEKEVRGIVKSITRYPVAPLPRIRSFDEIEQERLNWLWYPYICRGTLGLLDGDPGCGKSQFTIWLAAMLSRGETLPGGDKLKPLTTFLLNMEDLQGATIKPRLSANGADMSRIFIQDRRFQLTPEYVEWMEGEIARCNADLVILDPIQAFIKPGTDVSSNVEVRDFMAQLADVAERRNCAIICVRHFGKASHDQAMKKGIGSTDFVGISRNQFGLAKRDDGERGFYVFHMKTNFESGDTLVFGMSQADGRTGAQPKITFEAFSDLTDGEFFSTDRKRGPDAVKIELAKELLPELLANGPEEAKAIKAKGKARGISHSTMDRARREMGGISYRDGEAWYWKLPEA